MLLGNGATLCKFLAQRGYSVAATARKVESLAYLDDFGDKILKLSVDVNTYETVETALTTTLKEFGRIDVLVNNAGYGVAEAVPDSVMRAMMETNFWAAVNLTRRAVKIFREDNVKSSAIGGIIVNTTSMGGRVAFGGDAIYHASKWALEGFSEAMSQEMHPGWNIRFLLLEPGGTKSNFSGSSMVNGPSHPAYKDPEMAVNQTLKLFGDLKFLEGWASPETVVKKLLEVLGTEDLPLRLCTGNDAFKAIKSGDETRLQEMERWMHISIG